tara:strand:+ start:1891 stop:2634 length:744 start_codon:yes stop_codon:yes gene_type:complete
MFKNIIQFRASKEYINSNKEYLPVPCKSNIPQWYKKLSHDEVNVTVKGCMPFLDTLTTGYILKMPVDYLIGHNLEINGEKKTGVRTSIKFKNDLANCINLNYDGNAEYHACSQVAGSPLLEKNKNLPIHKILNPWIIKTPPGYSTLFLPPLNNSDDRFSIIPGIVETDSFKNEINFPFVVNGDKYPVLETTIKIGTPYVQLIPFKRENWKMEIVEEDENKLKENSLFSHYHLLNNYKKLFWRKKTWR